MTSAERAAMEEAEKALQDALTDYHPNDNRTRDALTALRSCLSSAGSTVALPRDYVDGLIVTLEISSQPVEAQKLREMLK